MLQRKPAKETDTRMLLRREGGRTLLVWVALLVAFRVLLAILFS
jgi:hypothetical protein